MSGQACPSLPACATSRGGAIRVRACASSTSAPWTPALRACAFVVPLFTPGHRNAAVRGGARQRLSAGATIVHPARLVARSATARGRRVRQCRLRDRGRCSARRLGARQPQREHRSSRAHRGLRVDRTRCGAMRQRRGCARRHDRRGRRFSFRACKSARMRWWAQVPGAPVRSGARPLRRTSRARRARPASPATRTCRV